MNHAGESSAATLLAHPAAVRFPSARIDLFIARNFLDADVCAGLISLIEGNQRPSTIADANGDSAFRTSTTCDLPPSDPLVEKVGGLLNALTGIPAQYAEPLQGQRYETGQEFKAHTDYFEPSGADFARYCSVAGQRTWTFMIYLNRVDAGGATRFKAIDKIVQPETGKLVGWNNRKADGSVNPATLHHAMKVRCGRKYVITQWYRERPCR